MKNKGTICRLFLCFAIASLLLTSCGESEQSKNQSEKPQESSVAESTEQSEEIDETASQVSDASTEETSDSSDASEDISFLPPDGAEILYGDSIVPTLLPEPVLSGGFEIEGDSIKQYLDNPDYDEAYYYVCLDTRITYSPSLTAEEEIDYYKNFGIAVEQVHNVYFAYVTKEQINSLSNDTGHIPHTRLFWIGENAKEDYISEMKI